MGEASTSASEKDMASWVVGAWSVARRAASALPLPLPSRAYCCICGSTSATFLAYAPGGRAFKAPALLDALGVVGSDILRFACPRCMSHDRERHLILYLRALGWEQRIPALRILHMAPERHLGRWLAARRPARLVRGDLFPTEPDIERVDLQALRFDSGSFDLVIANHVLEHVGDDAAALREIARVLAPGGNAILQTPYSPMLAASWEDAGITSARARLQAYGQEDHVRLYGRDFFQRVAAAGLMDSHLAHKNVLGGLDAYRHGVNPAEPLMLFTKVDRGSAA